MASSILHFLNLIYTFEKTKAYVMEGPIVVYMRLIDYNATALTSNGAHAYELASVKEVLDVTNPQFIPLLSYHSDVEQTLNIGSQSTGAGAGRITFNPFRVLRYSDGLSPILFQNTASGTPFKNAEIFFLNQKNVVQAKHLYKLVAVKTMAWSAAVDDAGIMETISFEYGGLMLSIYQRDSEGGDAKVLQAGWNRVRNIADNDPNMVIL